MTDARIDQVTLRAPSSQEDASVDTQNRPLVDT